MAAASYGTYAPQEDQPSSMENTLAHLAYSGYSDSPAEAQTALDQYWLERQLNKQDYAAQLQDQHQFAMQQLQQQMYEANLKGLYEGGKTPGMLSIMANSPQYAGVFGGADPNAIADVIARQRQGEDLTNLQHAGTAYNQFAQGGGDATGLLGAQGINLGPSKGPALVQAAQIRAAAQIAAAKLRAQGEGAPTESTTYTSPDTQLPTNVHFPKNMTDAQKRAYLASRGVPMVDQTQNQQPLPQAQRDEGSGGKPAAPPPTRTNVAPAPNAQTTSNTAAGVRDVQQKVTANLSRFPPQVAADIRAGALKNGGVPMVQSDGKGGYVIKGDKGTYGW